MQITATETDIQIEQKYISISQQYDLLLNTCDKIEKDLNLKIITFKNLPNGHHLWATTYKTIRSDDLEGLILYYYIIEIINYLLENYDEKIVLKETLDLIKNNYQKVQMYIVSRSDQTELRSISKGLEIDHLFKRIHGSPKPKMNWVEEIIKQESINPERSLLIGDSINHYQAATKNAIPFMAYNNQSILNYSTKNIDLKSVY